MLDVRLEGRRALEAARQQWQSERDELVTRLTAERTAAELQVGISQPCPAAGNVLVTRVNKSNGCCRCCLMPHMLSSTSTVHPKLLTVPNLAYDSTQTLCLTHQIMHLLVGSAGNAQGTRAVDGSH